METGRDAILYAVEKEYFPKYSHFSREQNKDIHQGCGINTLVERYARRRKIFHANGKTKQKMLG